MLKRTLALLFACVICAGSLGCGGGGGGEGQVSDDDPRRRADWEELSPVEKAKAKEDAGFPLSPKERTLLDEADAAGQ
jgi:hypothetical protein